MAQIIVKTRPMALTPKLDRAYGYRSKKVIPLKILGYCSAGSASTPPINGPNKIPKLPEKAKILKARACVLTVLCSEIIVRMVTTVPANTPAMQRKTIICQIVVARPNMNMDVVTPTIDNISTGLRPKRSAALPQNIITHICVNEKSDSIKPL
ncbi:hypothetical protein AA313_de0207049 [Arthrobotrys entomopaga]|nr:hypothetical protein AA313_de0207049 [Arthrobotrys entomopaga]